MTVALDVCNPGGMRDGPAMQKQPGYCGSTAIVGKGSGYAKFKTLTDGVNAMRRLLANDYIAKGFDTPRKIADRWAPSGVDGNNSKAYAQRLAANLGISVDTKLTTADAMKVTLAQAPIENPAFPVRWAAEQKRVSGK